MSQLPSRIQPNRTLNVPQTGITESLNAPGLAFIPPDTSGAQAADQLLAVLRSGADVVNYAGNLSAEERQRAAAQQREEEIRRRQAAAEQARLEGQVKNELEGQASLNARDSLPSLLQSIESRQIIVPDGVPVVDYASQLIDARVVGLPKAYADKYREIAEPQIAKALVDQHAAIIKQAQSDNLELIGESFLSAKTPEEARQVLNENRAKFPLISDNEFLTATALRSLNTAAATGNSTQFDVAKNVLGDRFKDEQDRAQLAFDRAQQQQQQKNIDTYQNSIAAQYNAGSPFDAIEQSIRNPAVPVPQTTIQSQLEHLDAQRRAFQRENEQQQKKLFDDNVQSQVLRHNVGIMLDAANTGGATNFSNLKITRPDGTELTISREEQQQAATELAMQQVVKENQPPDNATPEQQAAANQRILAKQIEMLSSNGVTYQPWKQTLQAGYLAATSSFKAAGPNGEVQLPANLGAAYDLDKRLYAINPRIRNAHLDADARKVYDTAQLVEKYATPGDPAKALTIAFSLARKGALEDTYTGHIYAADVHKAATAYTGGYLWNLVGYGGTNWNDVRNVTDVEQQIASLARVYVGAGILPPKDAIEQATQRVKNSYTVINGYAINTGSKSVPTDIQQQFDTIISDYAKKHGETEGLEKSDLSMVPGETDGSWILYNKTINQPVDHWVDDGFFTNGDLLNRSRANATQKYNQKINEVVFGQNQNQNRIQRIADQNAKITADVKAKQTIAARKTIIEQKIAGNPNRDEVNKLLAEYQKIVDQESASGAN